MHSHTTSKGSNVECSHCERERREGEIPDPERLLAKVNGLSDAAERFDVGDKTNYRPGER